MHYTLQNNRIEIIAGGKVIAFIEPPYFKYYPYFDKLHDNDYF